MESITGLKIVDRTILLLDLFGKSASRREGKLEIEKAQLRYRSTRIEGFQGQYKYGRGIGVMNPNNKRLLTDLDKIEEKMASLDLDLSVIVKNRFVQRSRKERSEEHTSELQSRQYLVCRLLLEKKK